MCDRRSSGCRSEKERIVGRITEDEVEYVAALARLELSPDERRQMTEQLGRILDYIAKLNELDTTDVPPTSHVLPIRNVTRPDDVKPSMPRDEGLALAPESEDAYFAVPRVIE
jgi:aspartyl-tRNA(Asn)/glutamyl-tRNA(Gln) amidotransferase subunit C